MPIHLVPAGLELITDSSTCLFSTYNAKTKKDREVSSFASKVKKWFLKDRIVEQQNYAYGDPYSIDPRYSLCSSNVGPFFLKQNNFEYILMNLSTGINVKYNPCKYIEGIKTFVDSGGFQLFTGALDFIDPKELAQTYNRVASIGVDLDIPCDSPQVTRPYLEACAKIQKANYEVLSANVNKDVELLRVSHGKNLEYRKIFMDILAPENPKYLSIAGAVVGIEGPRKPFIIAEAILYFASQFKNLEYIHCLGYTDSKAWVVYSLIEQLGLVKNIGGDSVSFLMNSASGTFNLPKGAFTLSRNVHASTPCYCTCSVCRNAKDLRLLNSSRLLHSHNLYILNKRKEFTYNTVKELLNGNIKYGEFLKETGIKMTQKHLHELVDYIQEVKANKFRELSKVKSSSLFGNIPHPMPVELATKYNRIIKNYENYYKERFL